MSGVERELIAIRKLLLCMTLVVAEGKSDQATRDAVAAAVEIDRRAEAASKAYMNALLDDIAESENQK